jgi:hypothetical protein
VNTDANADELHELYLLQREYEAALAVACEADEKWRLWRILHEIRTCIIHIESKSGSQ